MCLLMLNDKIKSTERTDPPLSSATWKGAWDLYRDGVFAFREDTLRSEHYAHLDDKNHVYLDYTGSGLASAFQLAHCSVRLSSTLYGNPHSINPSSQASATAINTTRLKVLQHLNADAEEYDVIFMANATAAAKLVGESYVFARRTRRGFCKRSVVGTPQA
ncbi:hypothetical protein QBC41DRAFT_337874 [Cercophora samala]|uniref:Uncharacterized protein n=1 Tax=Cercophora samala TaxID=330535 RepID=A0AA40D9G0_9PEZI|nr:hypothetical protein QBC41DRAFT_337874 [Cercophora samala]